jgi:hypothetical protein
MNTIDIIIDELNQLAQYYESQADWESWHRGNGVRESIRKIEFIIKRETFNASRSYNENIS